MWQIHRINGKHSFSKSIVISLKICSWSPIVDDIIKRRMATSYFLFLIRTVSGDRRKHMTQIQIKAHHTWMILESSSKEFLQSPQYSWANWSMYLFTLAEVELIPPLLPDSSWNREENKKESYMEATHKNNYCRRASEARTFSCSWQYKGQCLTTLESCARSICPLLPVAFQEPPHSLYTEGFPAVVGVPLAGDTLCQPCPGECWYLLLPKNKKGKETLILCSDVIFSSTELQPPTCKSSVSFAFAKK